MVLDVQPALEIAGISTMEGVDQVIAQADSLPEFDLHCPVMSLPLACQRTRLDRIRSNPLSVGPAGSAAQVAGQARTEDPPASG